MTILLNVVGAILIVFAGFMLFGGFISTWRKYRGVRVITCPENLQPAAIEVNALHAAHWAGITGDPDLRLRSCSRWPQMAGCAEDCLVQVEAGPHECLLTSIVSNWYAGKDCVFCHHPIGVIAWHERPPALLAPNGATREWHEFPPQALPAVFATHRPVCFSCHVVEAFRREHAEMVVDRPRHTGDWRVASGAYPPVDTNVNEPHKTVGVW
ncbi:MAG TPA: hypothetical protein VEZ11_06840 [Thermoanaerobaculia bacterium]|nr:hypothetical protein [Thermoanaerobaculia bacterium]